MLTWGVIQWAPLFLVEARGAHESAFSVVVTLSPARMVRSAAVLSPARSAAIPVCSRGGRHDIVSRCLQAEVRYVLLESAAGYALFERKEGDEVAIKLKDVQESVLDFGRYSRMLTLKAFNPFKTAEDALGNCTDIAEGAMSSVLRTFLEANMPLPKAGKKSKFALGVSHHTVGGMIQDELGISCVASDLTAELIRGCRLHLSSFLSALRPGDLERAQLGLAHSYSRSKVKFDVNRADKHIIQSIAILDTLDKDINTFAMRVREWYSWHFPELVKIVNDNYMYARCMLLIKRRESLSEESLPALQAILMDETKPQVRMAHSKRLELVHGPLAVPPQPINSPPSPRRFSTPRATRWAWTSTTST